MYNVCVCVSCNKLHWLNRAVYRYITNLSFSIWKEKFSNKKKKNNFPLKTLILYTLLYMFKDKKKDIHQSKGGKSIIRLFFLCAIFWLNMILLSTKLELSSHLSKHLKISSFFFLLLLLLLFPPNIKIKSRYCCCFN